MLAPETSANREAGTEVWTARGLIPIEQVCVGDEVFAQDEDTGEVSLRTVTHTFVRKSAPIVAVTLMSMASPVVADTAGDHAQTPTDSSLVTLSTTEEHPFLVESAFASAGGGTSDTTNWVQAANLKPGDEIVTARGEPAVVVAVRFTGRQATVYNLEVEALHNYRVGSDGVVVHNGLNPFACWAGLQRQWSKHNNEMRNELQKEAVNSRFKIPQGVWAASTTPEQLASVLAMSLEKGKRFEGNVPIPPGMGTVFMPDGSEVIATQARIRWVGDRIVNVCPIP